ncbi:MAG: helix-turn-helix domain-containing protein [Candidatus Tectimicrobiota bacterium]
MPGRHARRPQPDSHDPACALLGATIRTLRRRQGLRQADLAVRTGLHRNYISQVEHGQRNVTFLNLLRFASALQVPPSFLLQPLDTRPDLTARPERDSP